METSCNKRYWYRRLTVAKARLQMSLLGCLPVTQSAVAKPSMAVAKVLGRVRLI